MKNKLLKITIGMCLVVMLSMVVFVPAFAEKPASSKVIELSFAHTILRLYLLPRFSNNGHR